MRVLYRVLWVPSLIALLGMTTLFAAQPETAPAAAAMKRYTNADRTLRIDHPGNWKARAQSSHAVENMIEFEPARFARMSIHEDLQGSLMVDILKSQDTQATSIAGMIPGGEAVVDHRMAPIQVLHNMQATDMKQDKGEYPGFVDADSRKAQIAGREAIITTCTWTSPGLVGSRLMIGRRVTLLSGDHHVSVIYGCPKEMEPAILPVFDKMLDSLEVDGQGGAR